MTPDEIRTAREALGLSQQQLADVMGYSTRQRVSDLETGTRNPSPAAVRLIRLYLVLHSQAPQFLPDDWPVKRGVKGVK